MEKIITVRKNGSRRIQLKFNKLSRTKQAHKDECDINNILAKYNRQQLTAAMANPQISWSESDFSDATDYQSSLNAVMAANDAFMALPAKTRAEFGNNPSLFLNFVNDERNYDKASELGLLSPDKQKAYLESKAKKISTPFSTPSSKVKSKKPSNDDLNDD